MNENVRPAGTSRKRQANTVAGLALSTELNLSSPSTTMLLPTTPSSITNATLANDNSERNGGEVFPLLDVDASPPRPASSTTLLHGFEPQGGAAGGGGGEPSTFSYSRGGGSNNSNSLPSDLEDLDSSFSYRRRHPSALSSSARRLPQRSIPSTTAMSTASSSSSRTLSTENNSRNNVTLSFRASLDAGMAAMRRWIRSHTSSSNNTPNRDHDEEDQEDSFSLLPPTIFEHDDNVEDAVFTQHERNRQRTRSEPDHLQVQEFFYSNSVRRRRRAFTSELNSELTPPRHRGMSVPNRDRQVLSSSAAAALSWTNPTISSSAVPQLLEQHFSDLQSIMDGSNVNATAMAAATTTSMTTANLSASRSLATDALSATTTTPQQQQQQTPMPAERLPGDDRDREARARWIRINRRFQFVITLVALLFSVLLFAILLCWVVLTSTYIVSLDKPCDVGLKAYFWLVSLQLVLDVFRNDILRFIFQWDSNSHDRIPCRVLAYNMAYLVYALLVLRLGVMSVYMGNPTCKITAPELFKASTAFVSLSLTAWGVIIFGYVVPLFVVAGLLTCNGYNPMDHDSNNNTNTTGHNGGGHAAVFPAAYSTSGAPPTCIEQLPRIPVIDVQGQECCICMEEFGKDDVVVKTICNHAFHKPCCREWLRQARTCPVCRTDIPSTLVGLEGGNDNGDDGNESHRSNNEFIDPTSRIPFGPTGRPARGLFNRIFRQRNTTATHVGGNLSSTTTPPQSSSSTTSREDRRHAASVDVEMGRSSVLVPTTITPRGRYSSS